MFCGRAQMIEMGAKARDDTNKEKKYINKIRLYPKYSYCQPYSSTIRHNYTFQLYLHT